MTSAYKYMVYAIVVLVILTPLQDFAQANTKQEKLIQLFKPAPKANYSKYLLKSKNEIEGTAATLFVSYKYLISSQDMGSCVFTPSCSVYAIQSLQHDKPIKAYLKIFDRLSRCHPMVKQGEYPFNVKTQRYYDPAF